MTTSIENANPCTNQSTTRSRGWTTAGILALVLATAALPSHGGTYAEWIGSYPVPDTAMEADPDGDGVVNLLEFVLGGDPSLTDAAGILPRVSITSSDLVLEFERSEDAASLETWLQYGSDLADWSQLALPTEELALFPDGVLVATDPGNPSTQPDTITVAIPLARAVDGRLFARVRSNPGP